MNFQRTVHVFRTQNASVPAQHLSKLSWKSQSSCRQGSQLPASPATLWADRFKLGNFQTLNTSPHWVPGILAILGALLYDLCLLPSGLMVNSSCRMDWILMNFLVEAGWWWAAALKSQRFSEFSTSSTGDAGVITSFGNTTLHPEKVQVVNNLGFQISSQVKRTHF